MKMQEKKLKKFNIYSKIANVLFVLTVILGSLLMLITLTSTIVMAAIKYDIVGNITSLLDNYAPEIAAIIPQNFEIHYSTIFLIIIHLGLSFALTAFIIKSVANMFGKIVKEQTPFTNSVVKNLKNIGYAMFIYTGLLFVLGIVMSLIVPHPGNIQFDISIKWSTVFFGLLLFSLGEIFEFGMGLQQDNESIV